MTEQRSTKRTLLSSVLATLLCVAMLIGATFAWFTDTASTAVNKIQSGSLKLSLKMRNNESDEWVNADGGTLSFLRTDGTKLFADANILWEPGATYKLPQLKISNEGNLALKYKVVISGATGDTDLLSQIDFTSKVNGGAAATFTDGETLVDGKQLLPKEGTKVYSDTIDIEGTMKTTADNKYQNKTITGISITVVATQSTHENDSISDQYDKNAQYPDVAYAQPATQEELNAVLSNPIDAEGNPATKVAVDLKKGTYTLPGNLMTDKEISIAGTKDTVIDLANGTAAHDATITMDGITVKGQTEGDFNGLMHTNKVVYKNCNIIGKQTLYGNDVEFINCEFDSGADYAIWTYGAKNVTFTDCKFKSTNNGKSVLCYSVLSNQTFTRTFNNCTFTATGKKDKSAIMINPTESGGGKNTYIVNINDCEATGYKENGISGQTVVGLRNAGAGVIDDITVKINNKTVYTH